MIGLAGLSAVLLALAWGSTPATALVCREQSVPVVLLNLSTDTVFDAAGCTFTGTVTIVGGTIKTFTVRDSTFAGNVAITDAIVPINHASIVNASFGWN